MTSFKARVLELFKHCFVPFYIIKHFLKQAENTSTIDAKLEHEMQLLWQCKKSCARGKGKPSIKHDTKSYLFEPEDCIEAHCHNRNVPAQDRDTLWWPGHIKLSRVPPEYSAVLPDSRAPCSPSRVLLQMHTCCIWRSALDRTVATPMRDAFFYAACGIYPTEAYPPGP